MSKTILYLGLTPPHNLQGRVVHFPVIQIHPRPLSDKAIAKAFDKLSEFSHIIFTSKSTVKIFFDDLQLLNIPVSRLVAIKIAAVGAATEAEIRSCGGIVWKTASIETSEGIVDLLRDEISSKSVVLWPHSAISRPVIPTFLSSTGCSYYDCIFYDTQIKISAPPPNLETIDEIMFTSPSTVDGFLEAYREFPVNKKFICQGPVTQSYLSLRNSQLSDTMQ